MNQICHYVLYLNLNNCISRKAHSLNKLLNKLILCISDCCNVAEKYGGKHSQMSCLHFALTIDDDSIQNDLLSSDDIIGNILDTMVNIIYPQLLETTVKGDDRIETVNISWNHVGSTTWVPRSICPSEKDDGEIMVEVVVKANEVKKHSDAWRIVMDACLPLMHLLDINRCMPYSIHEAYNLLGISTAFHLIVQRLTVSLKTIGKDVFMEHLLLVSDCMAYTGNIIGFTPAGYRDFYRFMKFPVPLTEGTLQMPIKCFQRAAERGLKDKLSSTIASCSWGKRAPLGTGSDFEILWHDTAQTKEPLDQQRKDVHDFLEIVGMVSCRKEVMSSSLCLGIDFDNLKDEEGLVYVANSPSQTGNIVDTSFTSNEDFTAKSPVQMDGWGSKLDSEEINGLSGWHENHSTVVSGWEVNIGSKDEDENENGWNDNVSECGDKRLTSNWDSPAKSPIQTDGWGCSKLDPKERDGVSGWHDNCSTSVSGWDLNMNSKGEGESKNGWNNTASECDYGRVEKVLSTGRKHRHSNNLGFDNMKMRSCSNEMMGSKVVGDSSLPPGFNLTVDLYGEENLMGGNDSGGCGNILMVDAKNRFGSVRKETSTGQELLMTLESHTDGWSHSFERPASKAGWNDGWESDQHMDTENNASPIQSGWEVPEQNLESMNNAQAKSNWPDFKSKLSNAALKFKSTRANAVPLGERRLASQNVLLTFIGDTLQKDQDQGLNAHKETQSDGWNADYESTGDGSCWEVLNNDMGETQNNGGTTWANAEKDKQMVEAWIGNLGDSNKQKNFETARISQQDAVVYNDGDMEWSKNQGQLAPTYPCNAVWNAIPETSAGNLDVGNGCDSKYHGVTQNNSCPVQCSRQLVILDREFDNGEQVKSKHPVFGHKLSDAALKFKPTGANTVPLGNRSFRRSFSQNVPETSADGMVQKDQNQEINTHKETQIDGWNSDYISIVDGSCWGEPNKGTGVDQNTVWTNQVNAEKHDQMGNDIQSKSEKGSLWRKKTRRNLETVRIYGQDMGVHNDTDLEWNQNQEEIEPKDICNDGWNPSPESSSVKSGWDADGNAHISQCSREISKLISDPGFASTESERDVKLTICRGAISHFTDQEAVANAEPHNEKRNLSSRSSDCEWDSGQNFNSSWHDEQQQGVKNQGPGRGRGRGIRQFTVNRKRLDQFVAGEKEILQEVEPLMLSMRKILHFSRYKEGDRLTTEDETEVMEKVLSHHPEKEAKIGDGVDFITIDNHPNFKSSRCFFVVQKDGSRSDFSYLKCLKQLVQEKFPASAETFIEKYFSR